MTTQLTGLKILVTTIANYWDLKKLLLRFLTRPVNGKPLPWSVLCGGPNLTNHPLFSLWQTKVVMLVLATTVVCTSFWQQSSEVRGAQGAAGVV